MHFPALFNIQMVTNTSGSTNPFPLTDIFNLSLSACEVVITWYSSPYSVYQPMGSDQNLARETIWWIYFFINPNYSQQDATFIDLFIFTDALHVSGGSSAHHQEHNCTYSFKYCQPILLLAATGGGDGTELTIPEAVCTVTCS